MNKSAFLDSILTEFCLLAYLPSWISIMGPWRIWLVWQVDSCWICHLEDWSSDCGESKLSMPKTSKNWWNKAPMSAWFQEDSKKQQLQFKISWEFTWKTEKDSLNMHLRTTTEYIQFLLSMNTNTSGPSDISKKSDCGLTNSNSQGLFSGTSRRVS